MLKYVTCTQSIKNHCFKDSVQNRVLKWEFERLFTESVWGLNLPWTQVFRRCQKNKTNSCCWQVICIEGLPEDIISGLRNLFWCYRTRSGPRTISYLIKKIQVKLLKTYWKYLKLKIYELNRSILQTPNQPTVRKHWCENFTP